MSVYQQGGGRGRGSQSVGTAVVLNVYDLIDNEYLYPWGLGAYHSGVQVGNREYTYAGGSGVFAMEPKTAPGARFRESIELGHFTGSYTQLERALDDLKREFRPSDYDLLNRNCNTFADALVQKLLGRKIPGFVNRLALLGGCFSCCLPPEMAQSAAERVPGGATASGGTGNGGTGNGGAKGTGAPSGFSSMSMSTSSSSSSVFSSGRGQRLGDS